MDRMWFEQSLTKTVSTKQISGNKKITTILKWKRLRKWEDSRWVEHYKQVPTLGLVWTIKSSDLTKGHHKAQGHCKTQPILTIMDYYEQTIMNKEWLHTKIKVYNEVFAQWLQQLMLPWVPGAWRFTMDDKSFFFKRNWRRKQKLSNRDTCDKKSQTMKHFYSNVSENCTMTLTLWKCSVN